MLHFQLPVSYRFVLLMVVCFYFILFNFCFWISVFFTLRVALWQIKKYIVKWENIKKYLNVFGATNTETHVYQCGLLRTNSSTMKVSISMITGGKFNIHYYLMLYYLSWKCPVSNLMFRSRITFDPIVKLHICNFIRIWQWTSGYIK